MIATLADLINNFIKVETEILNQQKIKHPPTIGHMYEGLTSNVLQKSVFVGLNLNVVKNSFIVGCDTEFDVMLVEGEGEKIPYTDSYKYDFEKVLAVIQVKKNLYSKDIKSGFQNLQFLVKAMDVRDPESFVTRLFRNSFRGICRKDISARKAGDLTEYEEAIFHTLRVEANLPVRIVWGYNGFSNESDFRQSFYDYLNNNLTNNLDTPKHGYGPHNFPDLVICKNYSLIKHNGMPFSAPITKDNWWHFYASSSYNPMHFLLEQIWTRLCFKCEDLPVDIFGEDLTIEPVKIFMDARIQQKDGKRGWEYRHTRLKRQSSGEELDPVEWNPTELDETQHAIIRKLCEVGEVDLKGGNGLENFILEGGYSSLEQFLDKLKDTGLVHIESNKLKLLTDLCQCVIMPDGKLYAADNKSGRLTNWIDKKTRESKNKNLH